MTNQLTDRPTDGRTLVDLRSSFIVARERICSRNVMRPHPSGLNRRRTNRHRSTVPLNQQSRWVAAGEREREEERERQGERGRERARGREGDENSSRQYLKVRQRLLAGRCGYTGMLVR
eukprot:GHVU01152684.1.p1 GENE.GHVU01152684.1~~GHVU01152684.1.p1  ORF type:complete len:119 (-),score=12.86 GHVU01152684.1:129-485(-)